ncbi:MAG: SurA N-terminal domain-containing protein, partial [Myxococcota bacterium]
MLEQMREGTKHPLLLVMFAILVIVFVFEFGGVSGSEACGPRSRAVAASVNGEEFSNLDLSVILNRVSRRSGTTDAEYAKLQRQAAEKLALLYLLADEAEKMGMAVSEDELRDFILDSRRNVDFQIYSKDGTFDPDIYQRFVKFYLEMTIEDYQEFKTRELLALQYLSLFEKSLAVLPSQVDDLNALRNTKVNLEFIRLDPKKLRESVTFSAEEITAFAEANPDRITNYYSEHKEDYSTAKEVRVRRIMIKKAPESAAEEIKKKVEDKWATVKERILTKEEDFATVVKELSEDIVYKDKGGDMGWSKLEDMNEKTAKLVDGMSKGQVKEDVFL